MSCREDVGFPVLKTDVFCTSLAIALFFVSGFKKDDLLILVFKKTFGELNFKGGFR